MFAVILGAVTVCVKSYVFHIRPNLFYINFCL
jgi:hypothetical protein